MLALGFHSYDVVAVVVIAPLHVGSATPGYKGNDKSTGSY
jgi:hypothetical protein